MNIYAPSVGAERVALFKRLEAELGKISQEKTIVLGGILTAQLTLRRIGMGRNHI